MRRVYALLGGALLLTFVLVTVLFVGVFGSIDPGEPGLDDDVDVIDGSLETNQTARWRETLAMTNRTVELEPVVVIEELGSFGDRRRENLEPFPRFLLGPEPETPTQYTAIATRGAVRIDPGRLPETWNASATATIDGILVHEFTHVIQFETGAWSDTEGRLSDSPDGKRTFRALMEGSASFVESEAGHTEPMAGYRDAWTDPTVGAHERYSLWPYYRGLAHFQETVADPAGIWDRLRDPPQSTTALLRGESASAEQPQGSLQTSVSGYDDRGSETLGASLVDVIVATGGESEHSGQVAANLSWDATRSLLTADDRSPPHPRVWVTAWEHEESAGAFADGLEGYLDRRFDAGTGGWTTEEGQSVTIRRVDDDAVALLVGSDQFLETVSVQPTDGGYVLEDAASAGAPTVDNGGGVPVAG